MKTFHLTLATPERVLYDHHVEQVTLPTAQGEITVLANHEPLVGVLVPGEMRVLHRGKPEALAVSGGFIEVTPAVVRVLADTAERAEEIDAERADAARKRAEEARQAVSADNVEYSRIAAQIEKELARMKVARRYGHRGHHGEHSGTLNP